MTILQQPDALSLSMNLKKFIISSDAQISFVLKKGTEEVLSQRYDPDSQGRIEIDMRDVVHAQLSFDFRGSAVRTYEQTNLHAEFTAEIDGQTVNFHAVRGGVDNLADTATNFLTQNWLTWQPTVKPVTYYTPEFLTYYAPVAGVVKLRGYFVGDDGQVTSQKDIELCSVEAGKAYTIPVEYQVVVSLLYPDGKPGYYDVWVENASGERLTYIQRYYADAMRSISEDWVLFENSLGGVDCFRAYGKTNLEADHTHNLAEVDEMSEEYRVDTERKYEKNTGHLTKDEARWLLDFFPSQKKYIYVGSYLRQIVVVESNVTGNLRELPTNYTFTYKYADARPLLNLPRTDVPADMLDITIPEVGNFTIPPRLAEVPRLPLSEGDLFPVQNPYSETWSTTTAGALAEVVGQLLAAAAGTGGGVGHTHKNIDLLNLLSYVEEYLLVNGKKIKAGYADTAGDISSNRYIRKDQPDGTKFQLTIGEFIDSMIAGKGIGLFPDGRMQADRVEVRGSMTVKELLFNRWFAQEGNVVFSEAGTIERIEKLDDGTWDLYLRRRWEEDITAFAENDVSYGSINSLLSDGAYYDSWFRVLNVMQAENKLNVVLYPDDEVPGGKNYEPAVGMTITRRGNPVNEERQGFWYISSYEFCICYLDGVTKPILEESNYGIIIGRLKRLELFTNLPINYLHSYVYCRGIVVQDILRVDYKGVIPQQANDRGEWSTEVAASDEPYQAAHVVDTGSGQVNLYDAVWHYGCKWMCLVTGTTDEPRYGCVGWAMIEGNPAFTIEIDSSNGWYFDYEAISVTDEAGQPVVFTTLQVVGTLYNQDVTADILDADVSWTRDTGDVAEDNAWAVKRADAGKQLTLTLDDLGTNYQSRTSCKFKATALLRDGKQVEIAENYVTF
ncbi:hypothetical protein [Bacteroides togonis]|uniref:hypothetical protein n=1 Tax=Bacteroides togonis TaxID=1917883 RepID=UPI00094B3D00|nr:hypothetical protein [Bacteroides togonis]